MWWHTLKHRFGNLKYINHVHNSYISDQQTLFVLHNSDFTCACWTSRMTVKIIILILVFWTIKIHFALICDSMFLKIEELKVIQSSWIVQNTNVGVRYIFWNKSIIFLLWSSSLSYGFSQPSIPWMGVLLTEGYCLARVRACSLNKRFI